MTRTRPDQITLQALRDAATEGERQRLELEKKKAAEDPTTGNALGGVLLLPIGYIILASKTLDWSFWGKLGFGVLAYVATMLVGLVAWTAVGAKNDRQMLRVWLAVAVVMSGLWGWLLEPPWGAGAVAAMTVGYGLLRALFWPSAPKAEDTSPATLDEKAGTWGLPESAVRMIPALPADMPEAEVKVIEAALEDYIHLAEVAGEELSIEQEAALKPLRREAAASLREMLLHAHKVATLHRLATQRPGDDGALEAAKAAMVRLERMGDGLQQAASAAIRFMASDDRAAAGELLTLAEDLKLYGAAREELEVATKR